MSVDPNRLVPTTTEKKAQIFDYNKSRDWLNPISMSQLQRAVKAQAVTVVLNGTQYDIGYGYKNKAHGPSNLIQLKRSDGNFAPFGYIAIQRIMEFNFEDEHK